MKLIVFLSILLFSNFGISAILPEIFYAPQSEKEAFCADMNLVTEAYWRKLTSEQIMKLAGGKSEVLQNSYVSLSYLELFRHSSHGPSKFMAYVYANASHHLGRLVRFTKWPENHPLKSTDQNLVKGFALRIAAGTVNHELSSRLMAHSLELYKELSWSLASAALCGPDYTLGLVTDPNLAEAFSAVTDRDFIRPFVTFEQTFLQKNMYSDFLIGNSARAKMLDDMRFISFNGEEHTSFAQWCKSNRCKTSSFDLRNRIEFDVWSIEQEFDFGRGYEERSQKARIEEISRFFLEGLKGASILL